MSGNQRDNFLAAMVQEIARLDPHGTWAVILKEPMPDGVNLLPSTWALNIKWFPYGRIRNNKAHFCVRGDRHISGVNYFEIYAPVTSWTTVQMVMNFGVQKGWATRHVEFSNNFSQSNLT